jgi:hypothetical protein
MEAKDLVICQIDYADGSEVSNHQFDPQPSTRKMADISSSILLRDTYPRYRRTTSQRSIMVINTCREFRSSHKQNPMLIVYRISNDRPSSDRWYELGKETLKHGERTSQQVANTPGIFP